MFIPVTSSGRVRGRRDRPGHHLPEQDFSAAGRTAEGDGWEERIPVLWLRDTKLARVPCCALPALKSDAGAEKETSPK